MSRLVSTAASRNVKLSVVRFVVECCDVFASSSFEDADDELVRRVMADTFLRETDGTLLVPIDNNV
jgi:hypothetical protein